jgi:acyl-coenzyme A thioesterase PaaI-like protein
MLLMTGHPANNRRPAPAGGCERRHGHGRAAPGYRRRVPIPPPHPDAPPPGTALPPHFEGCFACGVGEGGLRMRFTAGEDLTIDGTFTVEPHHQGAPGLAHGGVLATAFDEALGALQTFFREPAVTASLQTRFRRPVPVGTVLHLHTRVDGRDGRKLWTSGDARLDGPEGPIAVQAEALFVFVPPQHFTDHGRPAEVARWLEGRTPVNP